MAIDINLTSYNIQTNESFIVDTNVWIYLFSPFSNTSYGYENFLTTAQIKKCKLFVNSQIISEYINVICRTAYNQYLRTNGLQSRNFKFKKHYQQTLDFKFYFQLACESVQNDILSQSKILPIKLWHVKESLINFHQLNDYNDILYSKMLTNNLKMVSHDKDFKDHPDGIIWLHY